MSRRATLGGGILLLLLPALARAQTTVSDASVRQVIAIASQLSLPATLPVGFSRALTGVADTLKTNANAAKAAWRVLVEKHKAALTAEQLELVTRWLVRESVIEPRPDLAIAADRARFFDQQKSAVTAHVQTLTAKKGKPPYKVQPIKLSAAYSRRAVAAEVVSTLQDMPQAAFDAEVKKWEEALKAIGDDAQLANIDLQNQLQQQQVAFQLMSTISKEMFDTAMAVIRKTGG